MLDQKLTFLISENYAAERLPIQTGDHLPVVELCADRVKELITKLLIISSPETVNEAAPWLKDFQVEFDKEVNTDETVRLFENLNLIIEEGEISKIDTILRNVGVLELSHELIASILRFTSKKKTELKYWDSAVTTLKKRMDAKGLDSAGTLFGLL